MTEKIYPTTSADPGPPVRLVVHGARGRMGARVGVLAAADPRFEVVAEITSADDAAAALACDAVVDFSTPPGAERAARLAVRNGAAIVVGTTGLTARILRQLDDAARSIPVLVAPNMAVGVAVFHHLAVTAARLLDAGFELALTETHHAGKRDAPSGTALDLAARLTAAGRDLPTDRIRSIRRGEAAGEHVLELRSDAEILEIRHRAVSRDVFALGALRAAAWLAGRSAGRYRIEQALGLEPV